MLVVSPSESEVDFSIGRNNTSYGKGGFSWKPPYRREKYDPGKTYSARTHKPLEYQT